MELGVVWLLFSGLCGLLAASRNRSGFGYFILAIFISPLICALLLLILGHHKEQAEGPSPDTHVKCPDCRELVLKDARKCKHCGCALIPQ